MDIVIVNLSFGTYTFKVDNSDGLAELLIDKSTNGPSREFYDWLEDRFEDELLFGAAEYDIRDAKVTLINADKSETLDLDDLETLNLEEIIK